MSTAWSALPYTARSACNTARPLAAHELSGVRAAAAHARRALPGPLGELAAREPAACAEFGRWGSPDALVPQLARQVLALPARPVASDGPAAP